MSQLVPIGQMGAAGRQIVETTPNVLATYRDAQVKEQLAQQSIALGGLKLQEARNSLAEFQWKERAKDLKRRGYNGDREALRQYMTDYADQYQADQKGLREALTGNAETLEPVVGQALNMYASGRSQDEVFQFLQQNGNSRGELDSVYALSGGFSPDDAVPDQLSGLNARLRQSIPRADMKSVPGQVAADVAAARARGDTEMADWIQRTYEASEEAKRRKESANGPRPTEVEMAFSILRNPDAHSADEIAWAQRKARGSDGYSGPTVTFTDAAGNTTTVGAPALAAVKNDAAKTLVAIESVRDSWDQYGQALFDPNVSPLAAGGAGAVVSAVAGVSNQVPFARSAQQWAKEHGVPGAASAEQIQRLRYMANTMVLQLGPVFTAATKGAPSNRDLQRVNEAIGLLGATQDINIARFAYAYITNYMNNLQQTAGQISSTGRVPLGRGPMNPNPRGPRPVVPQSASGGGRPANWNQMTPAQRAAWLRGN